MHRRFMGSLLVVALLLLAFSGVAMAAKGTGGGKHGGASTGSTSLSLVLLNSTDGLAHWGQQVTFNVSSTATSQPNVSLTCTQNGQVVLGAASGFYAGYPWPWTQVMTLSSQSWTGGAADCVAKAYYFSGSSTINLTSISFTAYA